MDDRVNTENWTSKRKDHPCSDANPHMGDWEPNKGMEITDKDRALAMDRALIMAVLFKKDYFEEIVLAINHLGNPEMKARAEPMFFEAVKEAPLTQKQKEWLWNYLKNYNSANNWTGTGW
jgi:hypothetical protein